MAYEPTVWETGDVLTAEKLNKAEQGIEGATPVFIPITFDEDANANVLDASYNELKALVGKIIIGLNYYPDDPATYLCTYYYFIELMVEDGTYSAKFLSLTITGGQSVPSIYVFTATDPDADMKDVLS